MPILNPYEQYQQHLEKQEIPQALACLQQHLATHRGHADGFYQYGNLLRSGYHLAAAARAYEEACRLDPAHSDYFLNLGVVMQWLQQTDKAIAAYRTAWEKDNRPAIRFNLAQALLLVGKYPEGWTEYEWRRQVPEYKPRYEWYPEQKQWRGQLFPGQTLVVYHEQGLGDDIQFCRYLPYVKALGGKVILSTRAALIPLLSTAAGADQVIEQSVETLEHLKFDWAVPVQSLPHLCGTTLDSIPNQTPYLTTPPAYRDKWRTLLAPYRQRNGIHNIGFVWTCNPLDKLGQVRTCPLPQLAQLFSVPNTRWFSVQKGPAAAELRQAAAEYPNLIDLSGHINDFADTAALLDQLDLLVSIDTSVPHVAGALGKPAWLLLPFANEWRWLLRRSDSPWYPGFRLFRQTSPGQWDDVLARVRHALRQKTAEDDSHEQ